MKTPPKIESGVALPGRGHEAVTGNLYLLRQAFLKMKTGDSFLWPNISNPYRAAKQVGCKITTRKINGEGHRIWLVTRPSMARERLI